jgi:hypothetical protein
MNEEVIHKLKNALVLTRLAQASKSPEMISQHLSGIELALEFAIRNEDAHG